MHVRRYWNPQWWAEKIKPTAQRLAHKRRAQYLLFLLEFTALMVFPIPVSLVLVTLITAAPQKWWRFALSASAGSVLASIFLFLIGRLFFQTIGIQVIAFYNLESGWNSIIDQLSGEAGISLVLVAGLTTGITRLVCLGAGFSAMHPGLFILLFCLTRSARFIAECAAFKYLGQKVQSLPRQYYHYATILLGMVLLMVMIIFTFL